ncbi:helicase [Methanohalophilus levihalophilus]|nr:helicase [Methanohalophilus levihalophilus]
MLLKDKKKNPVVFGEVTLNDTPTGPRPLRFRVIRDGKDDLRRPEEVIELCRRSDRILISKGGNLKNQNKLVEMLAAFHLEADIVDVCRFCLLKKQFNFVNPKSISYHGERVCKECAEEELLRALRNTHCHYSEDAVQRMLEILAKTRDLDRTLGMLDPEELESDVTKYDVIQAKPEEKLVKTATLPVSKKLKGLLLKKSRTLLPVQSLAVEHGLFAGKNLLVTSATATGKTLIGEMAGVENCLKKKGKMLYLVPLVALANQKYDQFGKRYGKIGLQTSIRIGSTKIKTRKTQSMRKSLDSEIIVATYEGIDYLLRVGESDLLGQIGTVVIDEVHMLEDADRGHRLDGVISRLKYVAPTAQFIYLSATVGSPVKLAQKLDATLVEYEHRPVPIERHLIFSSQEKKLKIMARLIKEEYGKVSSKKHRGQTIVFTNSRRNCHRIAEGLPMQAGAYHAGLSLEKRRIIEKQFVSGKLPVVVTTAALAAGVDFPASQVIFESLAMGIDWITQQEFLQMLGRAGRPDFHDRGIVVLLASPEKSYSSEQAMTEDEVAVKLLKGQMEEMHVAYGEEEQTEEMLACAAVTSDLNDLRYMAKKFVADIDFNVAVPKLQKKKLIVKKGQNISLTRLGSIAARHFLSPAKAFLIKDAVTSDMEPLNIVSNLEFFDAAYFKFAPQISSALKINMPSRVFQGAALDIVFEAENLSALNETIQEQLYAFASDFLTCKCKENPFCGCAEKKFGERIIKWRVEGLEPEDIVRRLDSSYGISTYAGDVYGYLDNVIRSLDAIEMMARAFSKRKTASRAKQLKKSIEG